MVGEMESPPLMMPTLIIFHINRECATPLQVISAMGLQGSAGYMIYVIKDKS